jgi:hypothetical protein
MPEVVDAKLGLEPVPRDARRRVHHACVVHQNMYLRLFRLEPDDDLSILAQEERSLMVSAFSV